METPSDSARRTERLDGSRAAEAHRQPWFRRRGVLAGGAVILVVAVVLIALWWWHESGIETTDDAFLEAHIVDVSPQVAGQVTQVPVEDNQLVRSGQPLVIIDPAQYRLALQQALAAQQQAQTALGQAAAGVTVAQASLAQANADLASAAATAIRAQQDLERYQTLHNLNPRAVARTTVDEAVATARSALAGQRAAQQRVASAHAQIASAQAAVAGARARIATAEAGVGQARLNLSYTTVTARVDGHVASRTVATWVLTSYLIANATIIPMSGRLSDVFGRKRYYMTSVALFNFASLCCGLSPSLTILILARIVQGVGGGGLQPVTQAMLIDTFQPASRAKAMSVYGFTVILAPMLGPLLGGWITDQFSWHWIFLINVPVGLLSLLLVQTMVDEPPLIVEERRRRWQRGVHFDLPGAALIALALGALEVVLDRGVQEDWFASPLIRGAALVAGACLIAFVLWELIERDPLLDMTLFRYRNFASATVIIMTIGVVLFGTTQFIPQLVQQVLGYSAQQAGLALTLGGIITLFTMPLAGILSSHVQPRFMMGLAFAVEALAMWNMTHFDTSVTFGGIAIARMWQGAPIPFLFVPLISAAYVGLPGEKTNRASAMISVGRNIGGSVGISLVQALLARREQFHQARLVAGLQPLNPVYQHGIHLLAQTLTARGAPPTAAARMAVGALYQIVQRQADMMAFNDVFWALTLFIIVVLPIVFLLRRTPLEREHSSGREPAASRG